MQENYSNNPEMGVVKRVPKVSVIISTFNGQRYIREAVQSILDQSFGDLELIVVNDGSTDSTLDVLTSFDDWRLTVLNNSRNLGIAASQNYALSMATGQYLALMDHDDISLPERLQMQVDFLDAHRDVGMLGTNCISIDENDIVESISHYPSDDIFLKWDTLLCGCPFFHTSLMVRRQEIDRIGRYSSAYLYAGDYDVISRLAAGCVVANLQRPLVKWRRHETSASTLYRGKLRGEATEISLRNVKAVLGDVDDFAWQGLRTLLMSDPSLDVSISNERILAALSLLFVLQDTFYRRYQFSVSAMRKHRRHVYWIWGKHFLALTYRRNGNRDSLCRFTLFQWAVKLLAAVVLPTQVHGDKARPDLHDSRQAEQL